MQALLDQIYAAPEEDAPRLVYADWLIERGDPLGTFIALQLERDPKREPVSSTEQALVDEHWSTWIGTPGDVLEHRHVAFERGMWSACELVGVANLDELDTGAPSWGTVRRLRVDKDASRVLSDLLDGPLQRSLRVVQTSTPSDVDVLATWNQPLAIEELVMGRYEMPEPPSYGFPSLPKLTTLTVHTPSMYVPRWIRRIDEAGIPNARVVTSVDRVETTMREAVRSKLARFVIESPYGLEITAERAGDAQLAVHTIAFGMTTRFEQVIEEAQHWLDSFREYLAPRVTITMPVIDPAIVNAAAARGIELVAASAKSYAAKPRG
jgi:uncharacterized protein (TIGR02996 family)